MSATETFFSHVTINKDPTSGLLFQVTHPDIPDCWTELWVPDPTSNVGGEIIPTVHHSKYDCKCSDKMQQENISKTITRGALKVEIVFKPTRAADQLDIVQVMTTWGIAFSQIAGIKREYGIGVADVPLGSVKEDVTVGIDITPSGDFTLVFDLNELEGR